MKYTLFEDHLKSTLSNTTANVDIDALIDQIHPLEKPNNKFGGIWFYSAIVLVFFVSSFGIYHITKKDNSGPIQKTETHPMDKNQSKSSIVLNSIDQNNDTKITEEPISARFIKSNNIPVHDIQNSSTSTKKELLNTNKAYFNNNSNNRKSTQIVATEDENQSTTSNLNDVIEKQVSAPMNSIVEIPVSTISDKIEVTHTIDSEKASDDKPIYDPIHCPSFGAQRWTLDILGEIGLLKPLKSLSYNGGPSPTDVYTLRAQHENPLEGIQLAAFVQVSKDQTPFYAKIGLSYTRITEQFDLNTSYTTMDTTQGIISITESQNGDTLTVIKGDIITEITNSRQLKAHHYFHLFDIPFGIGYEFRVQQFLLGLELGGQFNVYTSATGKIFESLYETDDLSNRDDFRPNVGMSYYAGINLSYPITNRSSIYASTRFRYIPNNFASSSNQINQKYSLIGIHVGYRYAL